jgi:hypothetical protein
MDRATAALTTINQEHAHSIVHFVALHVCMRNIFSVPRGRIISSLELWIRISDLLS